MLQAPASFPRTGARTLDAVMPDGPLVNLLDALSHGPGCVERSIAQAVVRHSLSQLLIPEHGTHSLGECLGLGGHHEAVFAVLHVLCCSAGVDNDTRSSGRARLRDDQSLRFRTRAEDE